MKEFGINILIRLLITCIARFGKPTGTRYLVLFKNLSKKKKAELGLVYRPKLATIDQII
jgi:hypothetical protein